MQKTSTQQTDQPAPGQAPSGQVPGRVSSGEPASGQPLPGWPGGTADPAGLSSVTGAFRRPVLTRRGPSLRRLAGLAGWAAALGVVGLLVGVRALIAILVTKPPHWYEPTLITMGLVGIALTAGAFLTIQRRYVPWALLGLSTGVLVSSIITTGMLK
ncbi:MAG: hypothetical protein AUI14_16140 [Actinobacteria bacterium 13_2_20CM_2_71_6]|nr:MAG: hypothetical protein AUI14_16140 [Actinobacteria bacterium 13_2_20CM_2_71_6]